MEPCTTWAKKVSLLVNLNQHNVPGDGIKRMLDNWEQVSLVNILRELNLDYKRPLQRNHPPIVHSKPEFNTDLPNIESIERPQNNNWQNNWQPKQIENRPHNFQNFQSNIDQNARQMQIQEQLKPLMEILQPTHVSPSVVITPPAEKPQFDSIWESTFVEDVTSKKKAKKAKSSTQPKSAKKISQLLTMEMHKVGCINENQNFANIRELYPNIQAAYLFDLFEKCKGDADWTVNVLLEDSAESGDNTQIPNSELTCECFAGDVAEWWVFFNLLCVLVILN